MNENSTANQPSGSGDKANLMENELLKNEHVKALFDVLNENGKDTSGLSALINHVSGMEDFVKNAEAQIAAMKSQLETMKEMQDHPIKNALQKAITALETKVAEIKVQITELKTNIIEGCKNAVAAFKEHGTAALDKLASFFHIKGGLQAIKNDTVKSVNICDKSVAQIEAFSKQYHTTGRALKNLARIAVGKEPIDAVKESGKLAKAMSAPYKAEKACFISIQKQVDKMIASLDKLEQSAEAKRGERVANKEPKQKKPTLMERLDEKKKEIKERELEAPKKERVLNKPGLEV